MVRKNTALMDCFTKAFHFKNCKHRVFEDEFAKQLLGKDFVRISESLTERSDLYPKRLSGKPYEIQRYIINHHFAPTVLTRSAFCERLLNNAVTLGCSQYVIFSSGYDSFSLRNKYEELKVFEIDSEDIISDKQKRLESILQESNDTAIYIPCDLVKDDWKGFLTSTLFSQQSISFGNLMGLADTMDKNDFSYILGKISSLWSKGSSFVFDYTSYTYDEIEKLLSDHGFLIYEHLNSEEIDEQYLYKYNILNIRHQIKAPKDLNFCLAVKRR